MACGCTVILLLVETQECSRKYAFALELVCRINSMHSHDMAEPLSRQIGGALKNVSVEEIKKDFKHGHEPTSCSAPRMTTLARGRQQASAFLCAACSHTLCTWLPIEPTSWARLYLSVQLLVRWTVRLSMTGSCKKFHTTLQVVRLLYHASPPQGGTKIIVRGGKGSRLRVHCWNISSQKHSFFSDPYFVNLLSVQRLKISLPDRNLFLTSLILVFSLIWRTF
jgi:hypothetical protein